jgi:hypothetical protein
LACSGPLAHDETVTIDVEGPRGALGLVVAHREGLHVAEAGEAHRADRGLGPPRDEGVGIAVFDHAPGLPDVVVRGRAGGDDAHVGAAQVELHRDHPAGDVRDHHRDGERRDARGGFLEQVRVLGLEGDESADAAADHAAETVAIDRVEIDSGIPDRHDRSRHPELGEGIGAAGILGILEERARIKAAHLSGDLAVVVGEFGLVDSGNTALAGNEAVPEGLEIVSDRGNDSDSGDDDAAFHDGWAS